MGGFEATPLTLLWLIVLLGHSTCTGRGTRVSVSMILHLTKLVRLASKPVCLFTVLLVIGWLAVTFR